MFVVEFQLRLSSMYSIRVPYSYQCARTYPLPAPSTIKGLCANALWRVSGEMPNELLKEIHQNSLGASSRSVLPVVVSACTVRVVPENALLRQFAFTHLIDCMIALKDQELGKSLAGALKAAPVYLGDSESLAVVVPSSIVAQELNSEVLQADSPISMVNTITNVKLVQQNTLKVLPEGRAAVLYMQNDPISPEAILDRYLAPLAQKGDVYHPLDGFSFIAAENCILIKGKRLTSVFPTQEQSEQNISVPIKRTSKKQPK